MAVNKMKELKVRSIEVILEDGRRLVYLEKEMENSCDNCELQGDMCNGFCEACAVLLKSKNCGFLKEANGKENNI